MNGTLTRQREWEERYLSGRTAWDRGGVSPALRHWLASGALRAGRVLVPGCGRGHEVAALAREGFQVMFPTLRVFTSWVSYCSGVKIQRRRDVEGNAG